VSRGGPAHWSPQEAERHLRSLELFGMRFGLDRMRRMMTVLGSPERSFQSIHVLGTNGKSSTTRMVAAILERHGLRTGAYLSPHLLSYTERVQIGELDIRSQELAGALARAAWAAERVNRTLAPDDHVTQFELLTAAAFWALAEHGVQVGVIEAGLGGRYDATSVICSRVMALTNVALEHTRWLGPTIADIAAEKLAVLGEGTTLVLGCDPHPEVLALARALAAERAAQLVLTETPDDREVPEDPEVPEMSETPETPEVSLPAPAPALLAKGDFQRRNFALAGAVAERYLAMRGLRLDRRELAGAAGSTHVPGRLQTLGRRPLVLLDGAHNPAAAEALRRSLPELLGSRSLGLVLGVLEDKDAAGMLRALLPGCVAAWFTAPAGSRALSPAALESLARQQGFGGARCEPKPAAALARALAWAMERPDERAVLATGSIYLVGELIQAQSAQRAAREASPARREGGGS
jgi:dihydrofolate synthase / folylpolyglutamate synthase